MALIVNIDELAHLSDGGRKLVQLPTNIITDVVRIIKRSSIRRWSPVCVFTELRISLDIYRAAHRLTPIVDITLDPERDLIKLRIGDQMISLTVDDIRLISLMTPST